jgi:hypothetical protein
MKVSSDTEALLLECLPDALFEGNGFPIFRDRFRDQFVGIGVSEIAANEETNERA